MVAVLFEQLGLVRFALRAQVAERLIHIRNRAAFEPLFLFDEPPHFGFDRLKIRRAERVIRDIKIVVKAVFNRRANGNFSTREQRLDSLCQHMGRRMPQDLKGFWVFGREDPHGIAGAECRVKIPNPGQIGRIFGLNAAGDRSATQSGPDTACQILSITALGHAAHRTIGQVNINHGGRFGSIIGHQGGGILTIDRDAGYFWRNRAGAPSR